MAIREAPARGRAGPVKEGRKAAGRSGTEPQPQRHLGRPVGRGGRQPRPPYPMDQSQWEIEPQITNPGFSGWRAPGELPVQAGEEKTSSATPHAQAPAVRVCGLDTALGSLPHVSGHRALLFIELGPRCYCEPCFLGSSSGNPHLPFPVFTPCWPDFCPERIIQTLAA